MGLLSDIAVCFVYSATFQAAWILRKIFSYWFSALNPLPVCLFKHSAVWQLPQNLQGFLKLRSLRYSTDIVHSLTFLCCARMVSASMAGDILVLNPCLLGSWSVYCVPMTISRVKEPSDLGSWVPLKALLACIYLSHCSRKDTKPSSKQSSWQMCINPFLVEVLLCQLQLHKANLILEPVRWLRW